MGLLDGMDMHFFLNEEGATDTANVSENPVESVDTKLEGGRSVLHGNGKGEL